MHSISQSCSNKAAEHENMTVDLRVAGHLQLACVLLTLQSTLYAWKYMNMNTWKHTLNLMNYYDEQSAC